MPSLFYVCKENKVYHQKRNSAILVFVFRGIFYLHVYESHEIVQVMDWWKLDQRIQMELLNWIVKSLVLGICVLPLSDIQMVIYFMI